MIEAQEAPTKPWVRTAEWGHWGITFYWKRDRDGFHSDVRVAATLGFPIGARGPCDTDKREEYKAAIAAWTESGTLPAGATLSRSGPPEGV